MVGFIITTYSFMGFSDYLVSRQSHYHEAKEM